MRWNKPLLIGAVILALGTGPLFLYVIFGPKDGNPIGLGLLFVFTFPFALVFSGWGGLLLFLEKKHGGEKASSAGFPSTGPGNSRATPNRNHGDNWP